MRIIMVSGSFGQSMRPSGGEALHVSTLSQALIKRGHAIAALTKRYSHPPIPFPGSESTFTISDLFPPLFTKLFQIDPVTYLACLRVLRSWRPDIIHLHWNPLSLAPIVAGARLGIPVIATCHSYRYVCLRHQLCHNEDGSCQKRYDRAICAPCLARGLKNRLGLRFPVPLIDLILRVTWPARRHVLQKVARFVAPSSAVAKSLRDSGFPAEQIVTIRNGLPLEDYLIHPRTPGPKSENASLLYVGRLVPGKGVQCLLEALPRVRRAYPNVTLTVVGDGPFRAELERLCASLGLWELTRFIGEQPRSRLPKLYAEADLAVIPSFSDVFPYVALEAAASGVPVVATAVGGLPEALGDDVVLVPPTDPGALAAGILTVLEAPELAAVRASQAKDRCLAQFSFETMVDRIEALYGELCTGVPSVKR